MSLCCSFHGLFLVLSVDLNKIHFFCSRRIGEQLDHTHLIYRVCSCMRSFILKIYHTRAHKNNNNNNKTAISKHFRSFHSYRTQHSRTSIKKMSSSQVTQPDSTSKPLCVCFLCIRISLFRIERYNYDRIKYDRILLSRLKDSFFYKFSDVWVKVFHSLLSYCYCCIRKDLQSLSSMQCFVIQKQ